MTTKSAMKTTLRVLGGVVLAVSASLTLAGPASAVNDPAECERIDDGYQASEVCQVIVKAEAVCIDDIAMLTYDLTAAGTSATTATVTFVNPSGASLVYADQPLSGAVNWPGTVVGANGTGVDWPGWTQTSAGSWVAGDEFSWSVPTVEVRFLVNPEVSFTATFPGTATECAPSQSDVLSAGPVSAGGGVTPRSEVLSATGSEVAPLLMLGGGLIAVGAAVLVALRLRRRSAS